MKRASDLLKMLNSHELDGAVAAAQVARGSFSTVSERIESLVRLFIDKYGDRDCTIISVPGRTELGGNHTDHQRGRVLAASVDMDILAVVAPCDEPRVRLSSVGFSREDDVDLTNLEPVEREKNHSPALIRGIARWFSDHSLPVRGFCAYTQSEVPSGSGLSSSAAFEVMAGAAFAAIGGVDVDPVDLAKAGQYAENVFFGKPCGLLDQTACACGGVVAIDFIDPTAPKVERAALDLGKLGYALCITLTGGCHADLTDDYAAVPAEMKSVAREFGQEELRGVDERRFYDAIPALRQKVGDRAILRAMHFFDENRRVEKLVDALKDGDFAEYLWLVNESGNSSRNLLQNIFSPHATSDQGVSLALAISEAALGGSGACRVHGGGFAGTIQAYVPLDMVDNYRATMNKYFGDGACRVLSIRAKGPAVIA